VKWQFSPEWDSNGRVVSVLGTAQDITQEKQAAEKLARESRGLEEKFAARTSELQMANAELARAAQLKDEFLANMSHELRTPLTVVLTFTEILKGGLYGPLDPRQQKPLDAIEESGKHLLSLITDILDVSKIEAGKLELELSNVDVESVCQSSLQLVLPQAKKKELASEINVDPNVTQIQADERRLKQILVNLLGNAVKFTPYGGAIGLDVIGDSETQAVHFIVWDTGIGIAKEDMDRLFQPFSQLDSSLTRRYEGTGLGLALVRRLTELHNGTIAVESEVGKGSRFTVSLPWIEAAAEPESERASEEETTPTMAVSPSLGRILLVEDNQAAVRPIRKFLTAQGYEVIEARDGAEAIRRAIEDQPDVILMDIQMPVMDGFEATRRIRANRETTEIPIIALTALAMPGDYERCMQAGASAYISKPLRLRDLGDTIAAHLKPENRTEPN
jgi:signal transduction histidine kinase/CheY-like chemotaxis protein